MSWQAYVIWDPIDESYWGKEESWVSFIDEAMLFTSANAAMTCIETDLDPSDLLLDQLTVCRAWQKKDEASSDQPSL